MTDRRELGKREIDADKRDCAIDTREIARDLKNTKDVKGIKDALTRNLIWVITTLITIGVWIGTVQFQGKTVEAQGAMISQDRERIVAVEKTTISLHSADELAMQKLEGIQSGIKDLKDTVEKLDIKMNDRMTRMGDKNQAQFDEIKKLIYKPVFGTTYIQSPSNEFAGKVEGLIKK